MGIIDRMDERFRMETRNEEESLEVLHRFVKVEGIKIPEEYINVIKEGSDMEISVDDEMYIRLWGAEGCVEMNEAYNIQAELPNSLAIGDDEGGSAIIYMKGKKGEGLYVVGFGELDVEGARYLAPTLRDLLVKGEGVGVLLEG